MFLEPDDPGVSCAGGHVMGGVATYVVGKMGCRNEGLARRLCADEFAPRDRYASTCDAMTAHARACRGCAKSFFRGDEVTAGTGDKGRCERLCPDEGRPGRPREAGPCAVFHCAAEWWSGVWPGAAGEIWPDEVRTTGFTLWRLVPDIGWVWAV